MRKCGFFAIGLWLCPAIAFAQTDPDWARREMERMQAQQERFDAQVERQRAEQERVKSQQERDAARAARQRAEQERQVSPNSGGGAYRPWNDEGAATISRPISYERFSAIFNTAMEVCGEADLAYENARNLLSGDEATLLFYYCGMYALGVLESEKALRNAK